MKANEAPEKIYLEKIYPDNGVLPNGLNYNQSLNDIEYVRKDAFIEKACEFISKHIESDKYVSADEESYRVGCPYNYFETSLFIKDFKKYIEGE